MADVRGINVELNVDVEEAITKLKAVQREAKEATRAIRELEAKSYGVGIESTDVQRSLVEELKDEVLFVELRKRGYLVADMKHTETGIAEVLFDYKYDEDVRRAVWDIVDVLDIANIMEKYKEKYSVEYLEEMERTMFDKVRNVDESASAVLFESSRRDILDNIDRLFDEHTSESACEAIVDVLDALGIAKDFNEHIIEKYNLGAE